MPTHRADLLRQCHSQTPAADIHLVNPLLAHVCIAVIQISTPVVVASICAERAFGRWCEPEIVMDSGGDFAVLLLLDRIAPFKAQSASHIDIADHSLFQLLHPLAERDSRPAVRSMLHYSIV